MAVGFYGGEPLLEFDLIKQCIEYVESKSEGKVPYFNITTNGSLLKEHIVDYLQQHHVVLMISLDGPKDIHDKNRRLASANCGTFDVIMQRLEMIKEKYPEYYKTIMFSVVVDPENDFSCTNKFFLDCDLVKDGIILAADVEERDSKTKRQVSETNMIAYKYEMFKVFMSMLGRIDPKDASPIIGSYARNIRNKYSRMSPREKIPEKMHHGGPCIPGGGRLFVNAEGDFYPCERVNETSEAVRIGNVDKGLDMEKVSTLLNIGKITEEVCKNCWALDKCSVCAAFADDITSLCPRKKLSECKRIKDSIEQEMKDFCTLKEFGYKDTTNDELMI